MKKVIVIVGLVLVIGTAAMQFSTAYKAQSDLGDRVEQQLGHVSDTTLREVASNIVREAGRLGIELSTNNVTVSFRDSNKQTVAQKYVSKPLHAQFLNKEAVIEVRYTARVLGIPFNQEITRSRLQQQSVSRPDPHGELKQVLDAGQ
jgi:hypothetical protein